MGDEITGGREKFLYPPEAKTCDGPAPETPEPAGKYPCPQSVREVD